MILLTPSNFLVQEVLWRYVILSRHIVLCPSFLYQMSFSSLRYFASIVEPQIIG